jgi:UDP-N-acetylglucosamine:LPS N-acetylglucosamine transferase
MKKVLYISGAPGLGHAIRDVAIAIELRKEIPDVDLRWLASEPAVSFIREAGGKIVPEYEEYANDSERAEKLARGTKFNLTKYASRSLKAWNYNADTVKKILDREKYDLIIGDGTYNLIIAMLRKRLVLETPFITIYDFLGLDTKTINPIEAIRVYCWNRAWSQDHKIIDRGRNLALFIGELEDIPDKPFGFLLPNRRRHAWQYYKFIGYVLAFDPPKYEDKKEVRKKLGYGNEPLVICSIGGTAVGKELLELCGQAYTIIKQRIPRLHMVLVCGPRLPASSLSVPQEVEVRQFVPNLHEHFAASDLAIVQAGGMTTLELTALRRPFLYFPLEGHAEQEIAVAGRLQRHQAGVRMSYSKTTAWLLATEIENNIGRQVRYELIPVDGAHKAAKAIADVLKSV